jgi:hypothetical protein
MVQTSDENEVNLKVPVKKNSLKFGITWSSGMKFNEMFNKLLRTLKTMKLGSITAHFCKSELELKEVKVQFTKDANN